MWSPFKTKRSAGVPVTAAVHRLLAQANAARDARRWGAATAAYREALERDAGLAHIWVQLGNMLKETGDLAGAGAAYERASALRGGDAEPMLQLGRLHWRAGDRAAAARCFEHAFTLAPGTAAASAGLRRALAVAGPADRLRLARLLRGADVESAEPPPGQSPGFDAPRRILLDVGDLLEFWSDGRLPTGIQRVQAQLLLAALSLPSTAFAPCAYMEGRSAFLPVDAASIAAAVTLSLRDGDIEDRAWIGRLDALHIQATGAEPLACGPGDVLVGLGSSWNMVGYFAAVAELKARRGVAYAPLVYDLAPVRAPRFFTAEARADFVAWLPDMLRHADGAVAISQSTRGDLLAVAAELGGRAAPLPVAVVPLDADTRLAPTPAPSARLQPWGLLPRGFVLLVATLEPRKGHVVALDAWRRLLDRRGAAATPKLVFVGKRGWLTEEIDARVQADPELASHLVILGGVGDAELDLLYRECLFTLYPSFYEGWGLPVTEALCHGRAVVTCASSSLPEAGGALALYVAPGDAEALADAAGRLIPDEGLRADLEARIRREHRPTTWAELARRLEAAISDLELSGPARSTASPSP